MELFKIYFLLLFTAMVLACDDAEIAAIKQLSSFPSFYVVAAVEASNGSLNLKILFEALQFNDPSHDVPFIMTSRNSFLNGHRIYGTCGKADREMQTRVLKSPPGTKLNGILFGCNIYSNILETIFILDNDITSTESDMMEHCNKFSGIPEKLSGKMKGCLNDSKSYVMNCLHSSDVNIGELATVVAGALFAMIAVAFVVYKCFEKLVKI